MRLLFLALFIYPLMAQDIESLTTLIDGINFLSSQGEGPCEVCATTDDFNIEEDESKTVVDCYHNVSEENDKEYIIIEYQNTHDAPEELVRLASPNEIPKDSGLVLSITIVNDNLFMGAIAVYDHEADGNDMGFTHATEFKLENKLANGYTFTLDTQMRLFTAGTGESGWHDEDGNSHKPQHFTNENLITLTVDNIRKGKAFYYKAGIGWQNLNQMNWENFFAASFQQEDWHQFLNHIRGAGTAFIPDQKDGTLLANSVVINAALGIQHTVELGGFCRIRGYAEINGRYSQISNASYLKTEIGSEIQLADVISVGAANTITRHSEGQIDETSYYGKVGPLKIELLTPNAGQLQNYMEYNLDYDPMMRITFAVPLINYNKKPERKASKEVK